MPNFSSAGLRWSRENRACRSTGWGTLLHGVEDLAVHKGITNGEHASTADNPDFQAADVALSYVYARRLLDAVRNALGQDGFDRLRNHDGEGKLGFFEKHRKEIHPRGLGHRQLHVSEYKAAGKKYKTIKPRSRACPMGPGSGAVPGTGDDPDAPDHLDESDVSLPLPGVRPIPIGGSRCSNRSPPV